MHYDEIISNVEVYGLQQSIKRAKYPMSVDIDKLTSEITPGIETLGNSESGSGHDQFLTGIIVQFDLKYTTKAWVEAERYHFFDFVSSQSTMHRIARFDMDKAYIKYVDKRMIEIMKEKIQDFNDYVAKLAMSLVPQSTQEIKELERIKKEKYLEILYSNPCGFQLTAGMTTNYRQLKTIYKQRKNHRLPEWRAFCKWIENLPQFKELCLKKEK